METMMLWTALILSNIIVILQRRLIQDLKRQLKDKEHA